MCGVWIAQKMLVVTHIGPGTSQKSSGPERETELQEGLSMLKPLDFSRGINNYQTYLSMGLGRLSVCTYAYSILAGKQSSVTEGCLSYPFLGHWATLGCEEERWSHLPHRVTWGLSAPLPPLSKKELGCWHVRGFSHAKQFVSLLHVWEIRSCPMTLDRLPFALHG